MLINSVAPCTFYINNRDLGHYAQNLNINKVLNIYLLDIALNVSIIYIIIAQRHCIESQII